MKLLILFLLSSSLVFFTINQTSYAQESENTEYQEKLLQHVGNIRILLSESKVMYEQGNVEEAKRLAMKAYIDNYEYLEDPVDLQNEELNHEIEIMLREELQALMRNNAPVSEVNTKIDVILEKMEIVEMIVPEFGTIAIMILIVSITSMIILSQKTRFMMKI